jgi:O-antigen ligase
MNRKIENFFAGLALLVPVLLIIGRAPADIGMVLVSLGFLARSVLVKDWQWVKAPWVRLSLAITLYMVAAGFFADYDREAALLAGAKWIRWPLFAAAFAYWTLPLPVTKKYLMPVLVTTLVLVSIDTLVQFVFGTSLSGNPKPDYFGRLTGPFPNKMVVGVFLERLVWPVLGLGFGWALYKGRDMKRVWAVTALAALVGITILVSGERIAFALFGLCGILFWLGAKQLRLFLGSIGVAGAIAAAAIIFLIPTMRERIVNQTGDYLNNLESSSYGAVWTNGYVAWKSAPIFGIGMDNFVPMCERLGPASGFRKAQSSLDEFTCARHPHNLYLEWLAATGLIGTCMFLGLIFLWGRHAITQMRGANETSLYYRYLGLAVGLVPFLWPIMSSMSFFSNWSAVLFWWIIGLVMNRSIEARA